MPDRLNDELLSAYLDNEVTDEERAKVEQALADSPETRMSLASLRQMQTSLRSVPRLTLPADFQERVMREAERRSATRRVAATTIRSVRSTQWMRIAAVAATIAAALVVGVVIAISRYAPEIVENPAPVPSSSDVVRHETPATPDDVARPDTPPSHDVARPDTPPSHDVAQPDTPPVGDIAREGTPLPEDDTTVGAEKRPPPQLILVFDVAFTKQGQRQDLLGKTLKQAGITFDPRKEGVVLKEELRKPLLDTRFLADTAPLGAGNEQFDIIDMIYVQGTGVQIDEIYSKLDNHQEARVFMDLAFDNEKESRVLNSLGEQTWSLAKSDSSAPPQSYAYRLNVGIALHSSSRIGFLAKFPTPRLDIGIQKATDSGPRTGFNLQVPLGFGGQRTPLKNVDGNPADGNAAEVAPAAPFSEILIIRRKLDGGFPIIAPEQDAK